MPPQCACLRGRDDGGGDFFFGGGGRRGANRQMVEHPDYRYRIVSTHQTLSNYVRVRTIDRWIMSEQTCCPPTTHQSSSR